MWLDLCWIVSYSYPLALAFSFTVNQEIGGGNFYGYNTIDPVDLNLDGYMDFVVKVEVGPYFEAYLNDPLEPGTFTMSFTYALAGGSQGVNVSHWEESWDVGDFTGDGIPDLLTAEREGFSGAQVQIVVFEGDGEGGFTRYSEVAGYQEERMGGIYGTAVEPGHRPALPRYDRRQPCHSAGVCHH